MHFAILGAGALGSILAAHLAGAGHRVQLVARGRRAELLREQGLRIGGLTTRVQRCEIVVEPSAVTRADTLIVTVKTYDTEQAIAPFADAAIGNVFSVQNGVMKNDQLAQVFGEAHVLGAMADFSGELLDTGEAIFTRNVCLHIGEPPGGLSGRVEQVVAAIDGAGINARAVKDIGSLEWSKFTGWVAVMLLSVLTRMETWRFLCDPDGARVAARITREMAGIAARKGISLVDVSPLTVNSIVAGSEDDAVSVVQSLGRRFFEQAPGHRMSSLQDLLRGRPLELEETAGYALALAHELHWRMPIVETCYRLVRAINPVRAGSQDR